MVNKALLGKIPLMIIALLILIMPFNIYANSEIQIVPTWSQSAQQTQWANKFRVTNFCESSNNPQNYSCQLTITVNGDYYGYVYFDGYINNQIIFDYKTIFISGGKGTFYYTWYQNGLKEINKVNIAGLNLVSPTDDIDLTQIIDLLTSINSYNQQQVGNQSTQIQQLQTVINNMIISNGYLDTLTKLRQWNIPIESYSYVYYFFNRFLSKYNEPIANNYFTYPSFNMAANDLIATAYIDKDVDFVLLFYSTLNIYGVSTFNDNFSYNDDITIKSVETQYYDFADGKFTMNKVIFNTSVTGRKNFTLKNDTYRYIPIYFGKLTNNYSLEFALLYGLDNRLLNDLHLIANGTTASQSAAQSSDSANSQLQSDSNTLFQQENGFKSDMNNAMQNVNTTFRLQDMGTKFVSSAQWVRSQYESLTNNTPFASLITFSLITGLALILLGKVYK